MAVRKRIVSDEANVPGDFLRMERAAVRDRGGDVFEQSRRPSRHSVLFVLLLHLMTGADTL